MPFNVLLLPLLGGYIFISRWNRTRFRAQRLSGNKVILESAIAGILFLIIAFAATTLIGSYRPNIRGTWETVVPFEYAGTSIIAFLIGAIGWIPLNRIYRRIPENLRVIERSNDFLEIMLLRALQESKQVSLTLKSGKVYIGFVIKLFDPVYERKYIILFPTMSGFRDKETLKLHITTDYYKVYLRIIKDGRDPKDLDDFEIVLPVSEIVTFKLFDPNSISLFEHD